jgi:hypothetical protein
MVFPSHYAFAYPFTHIASLRIATIEGASFHCYDVTIIKGFWVVFVNENEVLVDNRVFHVTFSVGGICFTES